MTFVEPAYEDRSLGDLLPAVARALGVDAGLPPSAIELPEAQKYVVFLIDGLGYELLRDHPDEAPFLHSLLAGQEPATVGVPSTTATSLTSLGTALTPGTHGVVGFTSRIPGTDELLNALLWNKSVDPREWQPHPTALARLTAAGVHTTVVNKREFAGSGLTVAGQRGAEFVGADKVGERMAAVVAASSQGPSLTYMYDGDLDWTGHRHGVASTSWELQLSMIDAEAEQLRETLPRTCGSWWWPTTAWSTRRPGAGSTSTSTRTCSTGWPCSAGRRGSGTSTAAVAPSTTSARRGGRKVGERAEVLSRDEAIARGWFGSMTSAVRPRVGDVVVAARGDFSVMSSSAFPYEARLVGLHGSLTSAEMLIPVLVT